MGRLFIQFLPNGTGRVYACKSCGCHLASSDDLLSKNFHSRNGQSFLFDSVINIVLAAPEERDMTTGKHTVRDIHCLSCGWLLGWRYEYAYERREKYKEGKYILEKTKITPIELSESPRSSSPGSAFDTLSLLSDVDEGCYL